MNAKMAAHRWAVAWSEAWTQRDAEPLAELYADTIVYRSPAFDPPDQGFADIRRYFSEQLPLGENFECRVGQPIASDDRAAVEWWASWTEQGQGLWLAAMTLLRFNRQGQVVEHRDCYQRVERRRPPREDA